MRAGVSSVSALPLTSKGADAAGYQGDAEDYAVSTSQTSTTRRLTHDHPHPRLGVDEALLDMRPLEVLVLGARVVEPDPLQGNVLLLVREPPRAGRVSREDQHGRDGEDDGDEAADKEDELVRVELGVGVAETVRQERTQDCRHAVGRVPDVVAERLLAASPPHGDDDEHGGGDGRLERAEDESIPVLDHRPQLDKPLE